MDPWESWECCWPKWEPEASRATKASYRPGDQELAMREAPVAAAASLAPHREGRWA